MLQGQESQTKSEAEISPQTRTSAFHQKQREVHLQSHRVICQDFCDEVMVQNERANAGLVKQIWRHIREQTEATSQEDHVKEKSTRWGGRLWKVPTEQMGGLIRRSKGPKLGCTEENTVARK